MTVIRDPRWPEPMSDGRILLAAGRAGLDRVQAQECLSWVRFEQWRGHRFTLSDVAVTRWREVRDRPMPDRAPWETRP